MAFITETSLKESTPDSVITIPGHDAFAISVEIEEEIIMAAYVLMLITTQTITVN